MKLAHFRDLASNGYGVSTMERDELSMLFASFSGVDLAKFELAVFKRGDLVVSPLPEEELDSLPEEDLIPVHVEYYDTYNEAVAGQDRVVTELNNGTLVFNGVPDERR